jgi:hypothetical protein
MSRIFAALAAIVIGLPMEWFWSRVVPKNRFDDPVYKKNVRKLIERNRRLEEGKE